MDEHKLALPTNTAFEGKDAKESSWECPEFKISGIFSSHMVLQREKPIKIWGFSTHVGSKVVGCFMGETVTATVGEDNRFELRFSARPECAEPQIMVISDEFDHVVTFEDILIGDVWIIGGQSNAEMHIAPCFSLTPSIEFNEDDNFRLFYQHGSTCMTLGKEDNTRHRDIVKPEWTWQLPDKKNSMSFSAIGWYFAKELTRHVSTPIGVVMMAAGGVCLRELMPRELASSLGYEKGANTRLGGAFDTLINPIIPLSFKAQIFFQGESEGCWFDCANRYDTDLQRFFEDERARFSQHFPIYNVQLSEYGSNCPKFFPALDTVRIKQYSALSLIEDMTLTVDMDLGLIDERNWAHSPRKLELAERLARLALAKEYGVGKLADAVSPRPLYAKLSHDKSEIFIDFTDVGTGLIAKGQDPRYSIGLSVGGFSIGSYVNKIPAEATITSRGQVTVKVPEGADTSFVNYCFAINVDPELYNGNNLPCPAFAIPVSSSL